MKCLLLTLLLCAVSFAAEPVEKIKAAFGMELGQTFDPAKAIGTRSGGDGKVIYQFEPLTPNPEFKEYYVRVSPRSYTVYEIMAFAFVENIKSANEKKEQITAALEMKYGRANSDEKKNTSRIIQSRSLIPDTEVTVSAGTTDDSTILEIHYLDHGQKEAARKEQVALDAAKVKTKGL